MADTMPAASTAPRTDPNGTDSWSVALEARRHAAGHALRTIPGSGLELGSRFQQELEFQARAEVLQAILAFARCDDEEVLDAVRAAFGYHVAAVETLRRIWGEASLTDALSVEADQLEWLLDARTLIDDRLRRVSGNTDGAAIERARAALLPERAPVEAILALRPRLVRVVSAEGSEALARALPGATAREFEHVYAAVMPSDDPSIRPDRSVVDAIVLRCEIRAHLEALPECPDPDALAVLERDRTAYRFVSGRLQARCGALLEQGLRHEAEFAADVRKALFSAFRDLTRALNGESAAGADTAVDERTLAERIAEAERAADEVRAERDTRGRLVENALENTTRPTAVRDEPPSVRDLRRERRRRRILLAVAGIVFVTAVAVNVALWDGKSTPPDAPFAPVAAAVPTAEVTPVGDIVAVEVSTWMWKDMDEGRRRTHVERAAEAARSSGAQAMHVIDETGFEHARWTATGGVELVERGSPGPR